MCCCCYRYTAARAPPLSSLSYPRLLWGYCWTTRPRYTSSILSILLAIILTMPNLLNYGTRTLPNFQPKVLFLCDYSTPVRFDCTNGKLYEWLKFKKISFFPSKRKFAPVKCPFVINIRLKTYNVRKLFFNIYRDINRSDSRECSEKFKNFTL